MKQVSKRPVKDIDGEDYRFYVPSDRFGQPDWLVDLEENGGRGECRCPDYLCVKDIARKQGQKGPERILCKHLKRAFLHWAMREMRRRAERNKSA